MKIPNKVTILFIFILSVMTIKAQDKMFKGTVSDQNGPMIGVSVILKNTKTGTVTDINGNFTIKAKTDDVIELKFIGYEPQTIKLTNTANLKIKLVEAAKGLNEVVVVGYGEQRKKDVTGSLGRVAIADMVKAPVPNFTDALLGRVAGVVVSSSDGQPGSTPNIVIRGAGSITQDNSPLWVIDGFPIENYQNNSINPNDIASIDVLKDASATAIYGARGSNGVIIVTTKKGKEGSPVVSFNASVSQSVIGKSIPLMDGAQYIQYQQEKDLLSNNYYTDQATGVRTGLTNTEATYFKFATLDQYRGTEKYYSDYLFKPAFSQNYDLSISGGTKQTRYYMSGNYTNQQGVMINSGYQRAQGRISIDQNLNDKVKVGVNANYSRNSQIGKSTLQAVTGEGFATQSPYYTIWGARPVVPIGSNGLPTYDIINGFYDNALYQQSTQGSTFLVNPLIDQKNTINETNSNNLTANGYINISFTKNLSLRSTIGIVTNSQEQDIYYNQFTKQGSPLTTSGAINLNNGSIINNNRASWSNENILTYNIDILKKHKITFTGLVSEQGGSLNINGFASNLCPNPELGVSGLDEGTPKTVSSSRSPWTLASFMGRINYNYDSRYYLTFSNRFDGSSKFSQERQWSNFSSGAFKWSFTNEKFMKSIKPVLSNGSFRLSYGQTGNNRVADFASLPTMSIGSMVAPYTFNNVIPTSEAPNVAGNTNLKWETTSQYNIGADFGFLNERIQLNADYYLKRTDNLLLNMSTSPVNGYSNVMANVGSIQNSGFEFSVNTVNVKTKDFEWTSDFNISFNKNKVVALGPDQESLYSTTPFDATFSSPSYISKLGRPVGQLYGYVWEGVYQYSDFNYMSSLNTSAANAGSAGSHWLLKDNVATNGSPRAAIQPGDVKYKDLNGDGVVDANDMTVIGRGLPIHTGGFTNNFKYKNFDLNIFFQWSYGNDIQNANRIIFEGNANSATGINQFASYADHWTPTNTTSRNFRPGGQGPTGVFTSRTVEDGSYLRLKTLSLGYNLPKKLLDKIKIKELKFNVSVQNLWTWTKYSGPDPEVSCYNSVLTPGLDWSAYPRGRVVSIGFNSKF